MVVTKATNKPLEKRMVLRCRYQSLCVNVSSLVDFAVDLSTAVLARLTAHGLCPKICCLAQEFGICSLEDDAATEELVFGGPLAQHQRSSRNIVNCCATLFNGIATVAPIQQLLKRLSCMTTQKPTPQKKTKQCNNQGYYTPVFFSCDLIRNCACVGCGNF